MHVYEIRPRADPRGFDLISDALPFGRLWYAGQNAANLALTVLINQLPKVFGVSIERDGPLRNLWRIAQAVLDGRANAAILAVGAGTLVVILVLKCFKRVPGILIAVVAATIAVGAQRPAARLRRQSVPPRNRVLGPTVLRLLDPRGCYRFFRGLSGYVV